MCIESLLVKWCYCNGENRLKIRYYLNICCCVVLAIVGAWMCWRKSVVDNNKTVNSCNFGRNKVLDQLMIRNILAIRIMYSQKVETLRKLGVIVNDKSCSFFESRPNDFPFVGVILSNNFNKLQIILLRPGSVVQVVRAPRLAM